VVAVPGDGDENGTIKGQDMADHRTAAQREPFAIVYLAELPNLAQLTRDELLVYLWAVGRIRNNPAGSWSAAATQIQNATGLRSVRQVRRCLRRLRELGVLVNLSPVNQTARWAVRDMPARGDILVTPDENGTPGVTRMAPRGDENGTPGVTSSSPINETTNVQTNAETARQEIERFWDCLVEKERAQQSRLLDVEILTANGRLWPQVARAMGWAPSPAAMALAGNRLPADWWHDARERASGELGKATH